MARGNDVILERVAHGNAIHVTRRVWIKDLPVENRSTQNVCSNLGAGQQCAEVALFKRVRWSRVAEARQDTRTKLQPVEIGKEECFVPPIVDLRNVDGAPHREAK